MKPQQRSELLRLIAHFRTTQRYVERAVHAAALACKQVIGHSLLLGRELIVGQRLEAVAAQVKIGTRRSLREGKTRQESDADKDDGGPHDCSFPQLQSRAETVRDSG